MTAEATVVVVPRERYSEAVRALELLIERTPPPFELVYVDAGSPRHVASRIARRVAAAGGEVLRHGALSPNVARSVGLERVRTPYVVFIDNDVHVAPGWLEALVRCAEETGAWLVGPLYLQRTAAGEAVHMAGGDAHIDDVDGRRVLCERHHLSLAPVTAAASLKRAPTSLLEFHCLLARCDELRRLGGLDPALLSTPEHVDLCLSVRDAGGGIMLEPAARITYVAASDLAWSDLPYHLLRFSDDWTRRSLDHFREKWHLAPDDPFLSEHAAWMRNYRRNALTQWRRRLGRVLGSRSLAVEGWLERVATASVARQVAANAGRGG